MASDSFSWFLIACNSLQKDCDCLSWPSAFDCSIAQKVANSRLVELG